MDCGEKVPDQKYFCDKCIAQEERAEAERYQEDILLEMFNGPLECGETVITREEIRRYLMGQPN